ncbi:MAG: serine/threonine protein phosphatase [Micrococcales bacterium 73-13]|nr:MAG: serine/threonine protein phosphatase [Micrococcales bacterium 73-13]
MSERATFQVGPIVLAAAAVTDVGLKRKHNEDAVLALPALYLVADGMGGYEAGDQASAAVVEAFRSVAEDRAPLTLELIREALERADDGVATVADGTSRGAGSTVAGAAIVDYGGSPHWVIFNVGDSRVYRHAGPVLQQVTIDHSLGQELYDAGRITAAELAVFPDRNVITRAIGALDAEADSWLLPLRNGERLLICSDGLTTEVPDELIRQTLTGSVDPVDTANALVALAKRSGGRDNISVVLVEVRSGAADFGVEGAPGAADEDDPFLLETTIPVVEGTSG